MGRHSSCIKQKLRKGLWSPEEDEKLFNYITRFGVGCWSSVPKLAGLQRCGKSCRLRWINYLRPDLKRGMFSQEEEDLILRLHEALGNRWAQISAQLPGRTDNEIKNFWNSCLKKKLMKQGIDPTTHKLLIAKVVEVKEEKNCAETAKGSLPTVLSNFSTAHEEPAFLINETNNIYHGNGLTEGSREQFISKEAYTDPLSCFEYDQAAGYYNSSLAGLYHPTLRPNFDQNHHHQVQETCLNFEFSSMPSLTSFDHKGNMSSGTDFSDHNSGNSGMVLNDQAAKESSSNSSNISSYGGYNQQMNINAAAAAAVFPWDGTDDDQKLEYSMFDQYHQVNGMIKTEVEPISPWHEVTVAGQFQTDQINSSVHNFNSFPLRSLSQDLTGADLDVFHHQIIS